MDRKSAPANVSASMHKCINMRKSKYIYTSKITLLNHDTTILPQSLSFCQFFLIFPSFFKQIYQMDKQKIEMSRTRQAKRGNFEQCNNLGIKARLNILSTQRSKVKHTILNIITLIVKAI